MGVLKDLVDKLSKDKKIDEETLKAIENKGDSDSDKIAEEMGQKDITAFVPKVDLSAPVEIPKGCTINECGEIIRESDDGER